MLTFSLKEYKNENTNAKIKAFIEYLYFNYKVSDDEEFDNDYFMLFTDDDLIKSLEYYIEKNKVTAQITADNYISAIKKFFKLLSEKYNIKNDIFINIDLNSIFTLKSKKIISTLEETVSKDYASNDQYQELISYIDDYLKNLDEQSIFDDIKMCKENSESKKSKHYTGDYYKFVSILSLKMIMKLALGNRIAVLLELNDFDFELNCLHIKNFILPLDDELLILIKKYIKIREYILDIYKKQESKLFIKHNGDLFIKDINDSKSQPEYGAFFRILNDIMDNHAAELFSARRIMEMLDYGLDVSTIAQINDCSPNKIIKLQNKLYLEDDINRNLENFFNINEKYIRCPFCNKVAEATSNKWVLVQFPNNEKKYLSCRGCKGKNEKRSI